MPAEEPRPVHDVRAPRADQLDERRILLRRILEIGILNDRRCRRSPSRTRPQRRALAARSAGCSISVKPSSRCSACSRSRVPSVEQSSTTISSMPDRHGEHAADDLLDRVALVVGRHHDRQQRIDQRRRGLSRHEPEYPRGCARCQPQAVPTIASRSEKRGVHPSSTRALSALAYNAAGSPGRRGASVHGTVRPVTRLHGVDHLANRVRHTRSRGYTRPIVPAPATCSSARTCASARSVT